MQVRFYQEGSFWWHRGEVELNRGMSAKGCENNAEVFAIRQAGGELTSCMQGNAVALQGLAFLKCLQKLI